MKLGRTALVIAILGLPCLAGCAPEESISAYEVLKPKALARSVGATTVDLPGDAQAARTGTERLLGAIVPYAERVWFFKLVGPKDSVAAVKNDFKDVITSLRFAAADKPEWTLPKSWKQEPGNEMRFATLRIDAPDPLEVSVSSLPRGEETDAFYAIININRWRGQLSLRPIGSHQLERAVETVPWSEGMAMIVDYVGTMTAAPMSAIGASKPPMPSKTETPSRQSGELKYDTPAGWTAGRSGGFRKAAFNIRDGDRQAEVTVIDLGLEAGDLLPNVNRWRDQIGLGHVKADELSRTTKKISIGQQEAHYVEMTGPGAPAAANAGPKPQSILAVAATTRERVWFIKLMGDPALVEREKPRFETFVKSLKLPSQ